MAKRKASKTAKKPAPNLRGVRSRMRALDAELAQLLRERAELAGDLESLDASDSLEGKLAGDGWSTRLPA